MRSWHFDGVGAEVGHFGRRSALPGLFLVRIPLLCIPFAHQTFHQLLAPHVDGLLVQITHQASLRIELFSLKLTLSSYLVIGSLPQHRLFILLIDSLMPSGSISSKSWQTCCDDFVLRITIGYVRGL